MYARANTVSHNFQRSHIKPPTPVSKIFPDPLKISFHIGHTLKYLVHFSILSKNMLTFAPTNDNVHLPKQ